MKQSFTFPFTRSLLDHHLFLEKFGIFLSFEDDFGMTEIWMENMESWTIVAGAFMRGNYHMGTSLDDFITKGMLNDFNEIHGLLASVEINEPSKLPKYIVSVNNDIRYLEEKIKSCDWLSNVNAKEHLDLFQNEIISRYKSRNKIVDNMKKIKWNAGTSVLATLFHDLGKLKNKEGEALFKATPTELAEIITSMFTDADGKELSKETIKTYSDPNRPDKKAKSERIELKYIS